MTAVKYTISSDAPSQIYITCHKHPDKASLQGKVRSLVDVRIDDKVMAKHKNGRFYPSKVIDIQQQVYYKVVFDDGSFSNDMFAEDIVSHHCEVNGPPDALSEVEVRWVDNEIYRGIFKGINKQTIYSVEFEDGTELRTKREKIYAQEEQLPKRVRVRMSTATERQHREYLDEPATIPEHGDSSRRKRKANSRYQGKEFCVWRQDKHNE